MDDIKQIVANPSHYGFAWAEAPISTGGRGDKGTPLGTVPTVKVTDLRKFDSAFPGVVTGALDGQGFRIVAQRVGRDAREKDARISNENLKGAVLSAVLGIRSKAALVVEVEVKVYPMPDGSTTKDLAAFKAAYGITE